MCQLPKTSHLNSCNCGFCIGLDQSNSIPVRTPTQRAVGCGVCVCCGEGGRAVCKLHYICVTFEDFRLVKYMYSGANGNKDHVSPNLMIEMYIHDPLLPK